MPEAASTTRTFSSADHCVAAGAAADAAFGRGFCFDFFFDTSATVPASRSHRDKVGWVMPISRESALAETPPGPVIRSTIRARKPSVYSVISLVRSPLETRFSRGGNYPDAGGDAAELMATLAAETEEG